MARHAWPMALVWSDQWPKLMACHGWPWGLGQQVSWDNGSAGHGHQWLAAMVGRLGTDIPSKRICGRAMASHALPSLVKSLMLRKRTVSTTSQGHRMGRNMRNYTDWDDLSRFKIILKGVGWFGLIWFTAVQHCRHLTPSLM